MPGFSYFLEGRKGSASIALLQTMDVGYAFEGNIQSREAYSGPGNRPGVVVNDGMTGDVGYFPEYQQWERINDDVLVGLNTQSVPSPGDLQRPALLAGETMILGDGNQWQIPVARRFVEMNDMPQMVCALPQKMQHIKGQWQIGEVLPKYKRLWELAGEAWDSFVSTGKTHGEKLLLDIDLAVEALSANYRIGPVEAGMLGLFLTDGKHVYDVLRTLVDMDGLEAITQKKTSDEPLNLGLGEMGTSADSIQLSAS